MRKELMDYISSNQELLNFLRIKPYWYRRLSRNPNQFEAFYIESQHFYGKTIPHRVEKFSNGVQLASFMMSMFQNMNQS